MSTVAEQATAAARVIVTQASREMTPGVIPGLGRPPVFVYDATVIPLQRWSGAVVPATRCGQGWCAGSRLHRSVTLDA